MFFKQFFCIAFFNHSNNTATNDTYNLNDTDVAIVNGSIQINSSVNAPQNSLSDANGTKISDNAIQLNDTPQTGNIVLSDALTAESKNVSIEENQSNTNEIVTKSSQALTNYASGDAVESEENEESATAVTASFGVYLEII